MIIQEGEEIPFGYGKAWRDWNRNIGVAYPIPFNIVARWFRDIYFRLRCYSVTGYRERIEREAYRKGLRVGNKWISEAIQNAYNSGFMDGKASNDEA